MPSRFHTNDKTVVVDNYHNALGIIKRKLYEGDYFTSTDSSINWGPEERPDFVSFTA
jgi:hypothetical protein